MPTEGRNNLATTSNGGMPDSTNTGVSSGITLTPSGDLIITQAGAVISGLNIQGTVYIAAPNVTLVDCKITAASFGVVQIAQGVTGAVVQNCEINGVGSGNDGSNGISGQGTFIGNNIYNVENGINVTGASVIKDNYIHDLQASGSPHYDGIQIDGGVSNVTISHNTVINSHDQTSAIMIDNYWGPIANISVDGNLLVGGGYTAYTDAGFSGGSVSGVSFTNNHMVTGAFGVTDFNQASPTYSGNVNDGAMLVSALNTPTNVSTTTSATSTAPAAPIIASFSTDTGVVGDGITSDNTLALKGTAAVGSTVQLYDGSTQIGATTADSAGIWNYITSVLADAKHVLTATATNATGQTSTASSALSVTVDTAAPTAPVLTTDSIVNTNHVVLNGTAEANSSIKVYDGTTMVGTGTTSASGAWSVTTSVLSAGAHALTATATDVAGNVSVMSKPLDPVIGTSTTTSTGSTSLAAPAIASFSTDSGILGDHITNDNTPTLTGTAVASSTVKVFDGNTQVGTATANSSGRWSVTTSALGDGSHSLTATDTDSSGHTSAASAALSVTIDTHAPAAPTMAVSSQTGSAVGGVTNLTDLVLKGTAEVNSTVKVFDGTTQIGSATVNSHGGWSFDTGHLASGKHSFASTDTDVAGNAGAASAVKAVAVTAPIEFTNLSENASHIATIKGTADAYSQIKLYEGSTALGTVQTAADGTWSVTTGYMSNKVHTFTAQEVDGSGTTIAKSSGEAILGSTRRDTLTSTSGDDFLFGNGHPDTFVFAANFGHDVIKDFVAGGRGHDTIQFGTSVFDSFASVLSHASQVGHDVVIAKGSDMLMLKNTNLGSLNGHDFHFA
ncbi:Ig-like domain-containing protein [Bradyrhizobium sp. WD16]|uniref:Ig-like domain-containing protein n=1 Tax=Bradyrhizobium sp. WD16 TaxID=1521768 RepID=UPI0020A4258C|nr:Ig-like domain-containing protein [Bradyrhizobium sp. WD16]